MSTIASVVPGEAPESDNEEPSTSTTPVFRAATITGEASESEDEYQNTPTPVNKPSKSEPSPSSPKDAKTSKSFDSLLHKKLFESNISLRNAVLNLIKKSIQNTCSTLTALDDTVMETQYVVQNACVSIKKIEEVSSQLNDCLSNTICTSYIPRITIPVIESDSE